MYLADTFDPPADLSQAYVARYQAAMQNLLKQSSYTVGTPRLEPGLFSYQIDVTITPNNSLADATTSSSREPITLSMKPPKLWSQPWKNTRPLPPTEPRPHSPYR